MTGAVATQPTRPAGREGTTEEAAATERLVRDRRVRRFLDALARLNGETASSEPDAGRDGRRRPSEIRKTASATPSWADARADAEH